MPLTKEQQDVVKAVHVNKDKQQIQTIGGFAGTGKSLLVGFLSNNVLKDFAVCAFTGKAAHVLRRKNVPATTIHSLIYKPVPEGGTVTFHLKDKSDLACSGFICDESSMISKEIYDDLVSFGLPIIFVGDHGQLEPVGSAINIMQNPMYCLETVHRNAGEIAYFAEHIRKGNNPFDFNSSEKVEFIDPDKIPDNLLSEVDQSICAFNKTRVAINERVRNYLGKSALIEVGEKIICLRNNKRKLLFNGMQGVVTRTHDKYPRFDFDSDGNSYLDVMYDRNQFGKDTNQFEFGADSPDPFDYGYCITAHKCVHPDTLVETEDGLMPIKDIPSVGSINTIDGMKQYINFVHNSISDSIKLLDEFGGEIEVTLDHKVEYWDGEKFSLKLASDLKEGEFVRSKFFGQDFKDVDINISVNKRHNAKHYDLPKKMTPDLAEFLGLMVADGTMIPGQGFRLVKRHKDVVDRFSKLCFDVFGIEGVKVNVKNAYGRECNSSYIYDWLCCLGGLLPNQKEIPVSVMKSSKKSQAAFLRGLFEDGSVSKKDKSIEIHSCYPKILKYVKIMLARFGIHSKIDWKYNRLYVYGVNAYEFKRKIGFIAEFKNNRLVDCVMSDKLGRIPVSREFCHSNRDLMGRFNYRNALARGYVSRKIMSNLDQTQLDHYYSRIVKITKSSCESMCVEVPGTGMFYQNGYNFGNSQGSEFPSVLVFEQVCTKWNHIRWAYTAASRAKEKLYWAAKKKFKPVLLKGLSNKKGNEKLIPDWLK